MRRSTSLKRRSSTGSYGARPLRRALQKYIEDPLSEALIQGTLPRPSNWKYSLARAASFCRPQKALVAETRGAGGVSEDESAPPVPDTKLYPF